MFAVSTRGSRERLGHPQKKLQGDGHRCKFTQLTVMIYRSLMNQTRKIPYTSTPSELFTSPTGNPSLITDITQPLTLASVHHRVIRL
jgi:hypothetical protein